MFEHIQHMWTIVASYSDDKNTIIRSHMSSKLALEKNPEIVCNAESRMLVTVFSPFIELRTYQA